MEVSGVQNSDPDLRLGKNGVDFCAFKKQTQEVYVLLTVRKTRNMPLQLTPGEPSALAKLKLDSSQFQALIDSAQSELKSRERVRL